MPGEPAVYKFMLRQASGAEAVIPPDVRYTEKHRAPVAPVSGEAGAEVAVISVEPLSLLVAVFNNENRFHSEGREKGRQSRSQLIISTSFIQLVYHFFQPVNLLIGKLLFAEQ